MPDVDPSSAQLWKVFPPICQLFLCKNDFATALHQRLGRLALMASVCLARSRTVGSTPPGEKGARVTTPIDCGIDGTTRGPAVGARFPDIILPDQHGQRIDLHQARNGRRALVVFYRSASW
jgi:hypothetical protein